MSSTSVRPRPSRTARAPARPQHAVDRRAARAGKVGEVVLRERHEPRRLLLLAARVAAGDLHEPAPDALLSGHVVRLGDELREPAHLRGEQGDEHLRALGPLAAQPLEVDAVDGERLGFSRAR